MSNEQQRANMIRNECNDLARRLRVRLAGTDATAAPLLDRLGPTFVDELHAYACDKLGVRAEASNRRQHPWDTSGWAKHRPR